MARKTGLAIGAGVATLALIAGCSSQGNEAAPQSKNADQQSKSAPAHGDKPFDNIVTLADTVSEKQNTAKTSHVQLTGTAGARQFTGNGVLDVTNPGSPSAQMTMGAMGQHVGMVLKDKVMYMQLPTAQSAGGKPWAKVDSRGSDPISQTMSKALTQMGDSADPTKALERLKSSGTITGSKPEQLQGQQTTHYTVQMDTQKLYKQQLGQLTETLGKNMPPQAQQKMDQSVAKLPKTMPAQVWLNDQQLPVKFTMTVPAPNPTSAKNTDQPQEATMSATYSDWGKPVTITTPPPDQVQDLATAIQQQMGKLPSGK